MSTSSPTLFPSTFIPTVAPPAPVSVVTWVFFGLFIFLCSVSSYLSRLCIALARGLNIPETIKQEITSHFQFPLTFAFAVLFAYLAFVVFDPIPQLLLIAYWIIKFFGWIAIFVACYYVTGFIIVLVDWYLNRTNSTYNIFVRKGIIEFLDTLRVAMLIILSIVLVSTFPEPQLALGNLFNNVNVITATLVVMLAPWIRNVVGGLSILTDSEKYFQGGERLAIFGMTPIGSVHNIQMRQTVVRSFIDGSLYKIPNTVFLRKEILKYGKHQTISVCLPLKYDSNFESIRNLLEGVPSDILADINDNFILTFTKRNVPINLCKVEKTELMISMMRLLQEKKIETRF